MNKRTKNSLVLFTLIFITALGRLWVHPYNFTPVIAILLFSVYFFESIKFKFLLPIAVLLFSDAVLEYFHGYGFYKGMGLVYFAYLLILIGGYFALKKLNVVKLIFSSISASTLFYLITNFAFFYPASYPSNPSLGTYSHDIAGISASYLAGLPFYKNMLAGDLFYSFLLFGLSFLAQKFIFPKANVLAD